MTIKIKIKVLKVIQIKTTNSSKLIILTKSLFRLL